jgi:hypothetical protein
MACFDFAGGNLKYLHAHLGHHAPRPRPGFAENQSRPQILRVK